MYKYASGEWQSIRRLKERLFQLLRRSQPETIYGSFHQKTTRLLGEEKALFAGFNNQFGARFGTSEICVEIKRLSRTVLKWYFCILLCCLCQVGKNSFFIYDRINYLNFFVRWFSTWVRFQNKFIRWIPFWIVMLRFLDFSQMDKNFVEFAVVFILSLSLVKVKFIYYWVMSMLLWCTEIQARPFFRWS